ncbi:hypothetical protein [Geomonas oryzae]|uniref:hypothetical protein n=1 Tax=Geomonas oryzae TaxID=2364273 RepID=UPI00100B37DE|nr:hypothetical protein [Geomonas oryzae]
MVKNKFKKFLIASWSIFLAVVACRESPNFSNAVVTSFLSVIACCVTGFIAISLGMITLIDNSHQKVADLVEEKDVKFYKVHSLFTELKKELFQNMALFVVISLLTSLLKYMPSVQYGMYLQLISILFLAVCAVDQVLAGHTVIEIRREVIGGFNKAKS